MIAVAMSGGVDSSAAAVVLRNAGHDIVGLSMQLWNQRRSLAEGADPEDAVARSGRCCSLDDIWDARRVASHLGFPFYVLNLEDEFEQTVVAPFVDTYLAGETPSPCVLCNNFVKFRHLVDRARQVGADRVATGHYARVRFDAESRRWHLLRGKDLAKDQSYFLFGLTQDQLARTVFPLGELTKDEVRDIAREAGLPTHDKPESQEICFVQNDSYAGFVERYASESGRPLPLEGAIVDLDGRSVGEHSGIHNYTVGQRKGLGAAGSPRYVVRLAPESRQVVVGSAEDTTSRAFTIRDVNWIALEALAESDGSLGCQIQIRNRFQPRSGKVYVRDGKTFAQFDEPQRAVTPGQAAVFYDGDMVLGGGWIERSGAA